MIPIDRQTLTLIAVVVCVIGLIVMFRELKTAKEDVEGLKGFSMNVMKRMQPVRVQAAPVHKKVTFAEPEKTEEVEEVAPAEEKAEDN
ncbi:hypothetical protein [Dishui Lake phycodnavirus 2]|nr:hypothetical protein [Dishui Lake phycodnavirus 2]